MDTNDLQTPDGLDYEPDLITLLDEADEEHEFEVLDTAMIGDVRYMALVPYEPGEGGAEGEDGADDVEMLIMRVETENGEEFLDLVDDEDELFAAGQVFLNRLQELYDIDISSLGLSE